MKLELKHLAPYLPYDLQMAYIVKDEVVEVGSLNKVYINKLENHPIRYGINYNDAEHEWMFKPLLRPLSSITIEEAYELGVIITSEADMEDMEVGVGGINLFGEYYTTINYQDKVDKTFSFVVQFSSIGIAGINPITYEVYTWLFKNHFDVFGLIDEGLAIVKNINTK